MKSVLSKAALIVSVLVASHSALGAASHPSPGCVIPFKNPVVYKWEDGWKTVPAEVAQAVFALTKQAWSMGGGPSPFVCHEDQITVQTSSKKFLIRRIFGDAKARDWISKIEMEELTTGIVRKLYILTPRLSR